MAAVTEHYANHLAPVYLWMVGGLDAALAAGREDVASLIPGHGLAVDLGAGFGMHSIPLAAAGYRVAAIDQSSLLLKTLRDHAAGLAIQTIEGDLLEFRSLVGDEAELVICMGDTLTHLETIEQVTTLCEDVARALSPSGRFVATFRDYSAAATGDNRFISVRSDANRILTCFLEETPSHMNVHDIIHERHGEQWKMNVSSYRKLRIVPSAVEAVLRKLKLNVRIERGPRGMVRIEASA